MGNRLRAWAVETKAIRDDGEGRGEKTVKEGMKIRGLAAEVEKIILTLFFPSLRSIAAGALSHWVRMKHVEWRGRTTGT